MQRPNFRFPVTRVISFSLAFGLSALLFGAWSLYTKRQMVFTDAAFRGRLVLMKTLYAAGGIDVNAAELSGRPCHTPMAMAALGGENEVIKFLLEKGAGINEKSPNGASPLMMAVIARHESTVKLLIANGANVNAVREGYTLLDMALDGRNARIVDLLKAAGARGIADSIEQR